MVLCVGKLKEKFYADAAAEYAKRLSRYCKLEIIEIPEERLRENPSQIEIERALGKEAEAIRAKLPSASVVAAMCIEGRQRSSEEFARLIGEAAGSGKSLVFLIGGSNGLDEGLKRGVWERLSMSRMTFPHHLARVMLLEQLYRGYQIQEGGKYHK